MFGGIASAGADRLLYAAFDGTFVLLDTESGTVCGQATVYPSGPERVHITTCLVDRDGTYLLVYGLQCFLPTFIWDVR